MALRGYSNEGAGLTYYPQGEIAYVFNFTNDANGIRLHRQIADGDTVTFSPPIVLANAIASIGQEIAANGTATLVSPGLGTFQLSYAATSRILNIESITVPAGQFETVKEDLTLTVSGTGIQTQTEVDTNWLAKDIGPVKATVLFQGVTSTSELLSAFIDHDSDGISATIDNCPNAANPTQTDTDDDGQGDACDADDDNDGVPDDTDAFPLDPSESTDTDGDGIGDNTDADADPDGDGFTNLEEFEAGTDPQDPASKPSGDLSWLFLLLLNQSN